MDLELFQKSVRVEKSHVSKVCIALCCWKKKNRFIAKLARLHKGYFLFPIGYFLMTSLYMFMLGIPFISKVYWKGPSESNKEAFQRVSLCSWTLVPEIFIYERKEGNLYWSFSIHQELPDMFSHELLILCKEDVKDFKDEEPASRKA